MNRSPFIAFAGGTIIIAVMVLTAFANLANAAEPTCPRSRIKTTTEQIQPSNDQEKAEEA